MIGTQLLHDVILVLAVLVGLTAALTGAMLAAPSVSRPRRKPYGGTRRDQQPEPEPEPEPQPQPDAEVERERELVLL
jgi:hypothetical protein